MRRVKRLDRWQALLFVLLRDVGRVGHLDLSRVFEHDRRKVARGECAVDVPLEALLVEVGQIADVVDVRVAEDHGVHRLGVEWERQVAFNRLLALALV